MRLTKEQAEQNRHLIDAHICVSFYLVRHAPRQTVTELYGQICALRVEASHQVGIGVALIGRVAQ